MISLTPADGAVDVAVDIPALMITFSEEIQFGTTVSIRLYKTTGDVLVQEWTEADVVGGMIDSDTLEIVPDDPFEESTAYYVRIDAGSIKDLAGNSFAGINNNTTWNFTSDAAGYGAEATALFAAMSVAPDDTRKGHIDTLIAALKTAGIWAKLDVLWVPAAHDVQAARLNWKDPASFTLSEVSSPTFTTDRGYTGNGTSSYLNTGWDPANNGVQHALNSASLGVYVNGGLATAAAVTEIGGSDGTNAAFIQARAFTSNDVIWARVNSSVSQGYALGLITTSYGLTVMNRSGASAVQAYKNGSVLDTSTAAASALTSRDFYLLASNNNGTPGSFSSRRVAVAFAGASLGSTEQANLDSALDTYLVAIGAN
jgi:hypothetical protein